MVMVMVSVRRRTDKVSVEPETKNLLVPYCNVRIRMKIATNSPITRQKDDTRTNTTTKTNKARQHNTTRDNTTHDKTSQS